MTSSQESSEEGAAAGANCGPSMGIESLAGAFHPHSIEVQDFAYYALVIDLRSKAEYDDDHIPGAVRVDLPDDLERVATADVAAAVGLTAEEPAAMPFWPALEAAVSAVKLDQAILVYCGRGGLMSTPVAKALRWRGWTTDVLPGGWINYRRWVQAGLEVLPRMVPFRVVACTLGSENARVLAALRGAGQQVLDLETLASHRRFAFTPTDVAQPAQAWFDSLLLQELRGFDPRRPVWVADVGSMLGSIRLPGSLCDALGIAPASSFQARVDARVDAWRADERLCANADGLLHAASLLAPPPTTAQLTRWRELATSGGANKLLAGILGEFLDAAYAAERASRPARQHPLTPIVAASLESAQLVDAVARYTSATSGRSPAT